jgi:hypothetical protein
MKRFALAISLAALALPLAAQPAATDNTQDSPLVRAAKASKKANGGKSVVITNDNLVKSGGGHMSTANVSPVPAYPAAATSTQPAGPPPAAVYALRVKQEAEAKAKKEAAAKKDAQTRNVAADLYGESVEDRVEDPSVQEHLMNQMTTGQPQTTTSSQPRTVQTNQKPPQN